MVSLNLVCPHRDCVWSVQNLPLNEGQTALAGGGIYDAEDLRSIVEDPEQRANIWPYHLSSTGRDACDEPVD
jgi:hypothetical protein